MGLCRDISELQYCFQPIVKRIIQIGQTKGTNLVVNETLRSDRIQKAYYAQGRIALVEVNNLRKVAGLYQITDLENKIITNVEHVSPDYGHGAGLAVDLVPDGKWCSPKEKWAIIGECVNQINKEYEDMLKECNSSVIWGGSWKSLSDKPHVEWKKNV